MMMIDKLAYSSKLRNKHPALKAAFAVGTLLICVGARSFIVSLMTLIIIGGLTVLSGRISFLRYLKLLSLPFGFLILGTAAIMVNITDHPLDLFSLQVGTTYLAVSHHSLREGAVLAATALASVSCLYFLTLSTAMLDILNLLRRLHCPKLMVELMLLIYRYLFVVMDMAKAITVSQHCRLGNRDFRTELHSAGQLFAVLLIKSLKRSSLLFDAMESRCYDGEIRVLYEYYPVKKLEIFGVSAFLGIMLTIALISS